jgi:hypothetical protein
MFHVIKVIKAGSAMIDEKHNKNNKISTSGKNLLSKTSFSVSRISAETVYDAAIFIKF